MPRFAFRALELHSAYAWDMAWARRALDFIRAHDMTALVLHRNDIVDLVVYPGAAFGASEDCANIFERYQQIFRTLYRYTPTRRSGPYQRRDYLRRVCELAARQGTEVWLENKELSFHEIFLEFYPQLTKDGTVCPNELFWWEFLDAKYTELFQDLPGLAGIITAPGTGESRLSAAANRCDCELCRATTRPQWYGKLISAMHAPIRAAGKQLAVRDFVFDRAAHEELADGDRATAARHHHQPEEHAARLLPDLSRQSAPRPRGPAPAVDRIRLHGPVFRLGRRAGDHDRRHRPAPSLAEGAGASGVVFRTDWESLDGTAPFIRPTW